MKEIPFTLSPERTVNVEASQTREVQKFFAQELTEGDHDDEIGRKFVHQLHEFV